MPFMVVRIPGPFAPGRMKRIWKDTLIGILMGVASGLGALAFNWMVDTGTRLFKADRVAFLVPGHDPEGILFGFPLRRWMMPWIPALGGLLSGLIVLRFAPEAEGHGTDAMIESFHRKKGGREKTDTSWSR
jgi:chloride channel protein, CIC family